jgi:hypothetical protein
MLGFKSKPKTPDVHPTTLFRQELSRILSAARSRHVGQKTLADILQANADVLKRQAAINWQPAKMHSGNLS